MRPAALVTGAADRIGKGIALHLAAKGYDIALHCRQSKAKAEAAAQEIAARNVVCQVFQADLTDPAQRQLLIDQAHTAFPHLSVLVNNAAVFDSGSFLDSDPALYRREFDINLDAPVFLTQAFARRIRRGVVVNMLDTRVSQDKHSHFYYLLSKKALLAFTRMAAAELAPDIRVNGVCPGYILASPEWGEDYKQQLEKRLPMKKTAGIDDVAQAVYSLIAGTALTGQVLYVDGGESLL